MNVKRLVTLSLAAILLVSLLAAVSYGYRLAGIGAAYTAKTVCSEVFVAGRAADAVIGELAIDDLQALRFFTTRLATRSRTVSASLFGFVEHKAAYRDGTGCTLLFGANRNTDEQALAHPEPATVHSPGLAHALNPRLATVLESAFAEPDPERLRRTRAVVVLHRGRLVGERYATGFSAATPLPGWSMTKSVINALAGVLVEQGRLGRDEPLPLAQWRSPGDPRGRITPDQLLRMSSGLQFDEEMANPLADVTRMLLAEPDSAAFAAGKPLVAEPGNRWHYSSGNSNILSRAMREVLGDKAYRRFPRSALFTRIGMDSAVLETDASGTFVGSSFMYASARDWARFGMLFLQNGIWQGERLLPEGWVDYSRSPAPADPTRAYGAHFWLRLPPVYRASHTALPPDTFHAVGHEGQFITIVPSQEAVIVRLGRTRYAHAWDQGRFVQAVLSALADTQQPKSGEDAGPGNDRQHIRRAIDIGHHTLVVAFQ